MYWKISDKRFNQSDQISSDFVAHRDSVTRSRDTRTYISQIVSVIISTYQTPSAQLHHNTIMLECLGRIITVATGILFPNAGAKEEYTNDDGAQAAATAQAYGNRRRHICHDGHVEYGLAPQTSLHCNFFGIQESFLENYDWKVHSQYRNKEEMTSWTSCLSSE